ncbi:MAG: acyl-CoA dehydrogenase family protein [Hyphomonadaceae bacterium]|nr:acyl-CoA dehydrogenase family protein [Hyphomonadaceae bacterium]
MDFEDSPQEAEFRAEAREWIARHAPFDLVKAFRSGLCARSDLVTGARDWQRKKFEAGWACLHWPKAYGGRDAAVMEKIIWDQEEAPVGALNELVLIGQGMCAPTLMHYANDAQKARHLPRIASGDEIWCQMFSEPSAGSDLAGLRTRAEPDGDDWILNGQKIWTSWAHEADFGIILTRSDPSVPKHRGLTMFYLDMRAPGVEVRPIRQANGDTVFNEVFLTDVRIPDAQRLGEVNQGWRVSLTTLMNERMSIGSGIPTGLPEILDYVTALEASGSGFSAGAAFDDKLADWACRANGLKYTSARLISALSQGREPGPEASIGKLVAGELMQDIAIETWDLLGGQVPHGDASLRARHSLVHSVLMRSPAVRIEGGSDEILRNIIGERVLGLPAEPRADKHLAFNAGPAKAAN